LKSQTTNQIWKFPYRKYIVYTLNISDTEVIDHSVGGFIIGEKGAEIVFEGQSPRKT